MEEPCRCLSLSQTSYGWLLTENQANLLWDGAPSSGPDTFSAVRFWAGCTTNTSVFVSSEFGSGDRFDYDCVRHHA
jgi:hypothetical protein